MDDDIGDMVETMVVKLDISKAEAGAVKVDTYKTKPSGIELAPNYSHEPGTTNLSHGERAGSTSNDGGCHNYIQFSGKLSHSVTAHHI